MQKTTATTTKPKRGRPFGTKNKQTKTITNMDDFYTEVFSSNLITRAKCVIANFIYNS